MARKSIEDVMNEIEDFLNSCKTTALSSNKIIVPRDEFDDLFGELKVKIPAEIDRCKKIMRNKEAILMDARKTADGIIAEATAQANQMVMETEIMAQANQKAYETVEMARVQANEVLAQASADANEIRLGSMQYTNDLMMGMRNYVEATMEAERANYENLIQALENDYAIATANLEEVQSQIVDFTGDPNSVTKAPQMKTVRSAAVKEEPKTKPGMVQRMKQAAGIKEQKPEVKEEAPKAAVNIPDFITSGEKVVPNETPLEPTVSVAAKAPATPAADETAAAVVQPDVQPKNDEPAPIPEMETAAPKKIKKKIVKKRTPVIHTPQTAQETVAKTLEAAAAAKVDKTVYKANGEQAREVPPMEGRVKRGPRVGRSMIEELGQQDTDFIEIDTQSVEQPAGKSMGVVDDFSMEDKF